MVGVQYVGSQYNVLTKAVVRAIIRMNIYIVKIFFNNTKFYDMGKYSSEEQERLEFYGKIFPNFKTIIKKRDYLWPIERYNQRVRELGELGFKNPVKMIRISHTLLDSSLSTLIEKLNCLSDMGFANPIKMVETMPLIVSLSVIYLREKIVEIESLGFKNPYKTITSYPALICLASENLNSKVKRLNEIGFNDVDKLLLKLPMIFGLSIDNIKSKVDFLIKLGFKY